MRIAGKVVLQKLEVNLVPVHLIQNCKEDREREGWIKF